MGTMFRQRIGSDQILPESIYARHFGPLVNDDEWTTLTCPIYPCSDYTIMWDNSSGKWVRVTINKLVNDVIGS